MVYDKWKAVAMAFLLYADKHGVMAYKKVFGLLRGIFSAEKALRASREFAKKEYIVKLGLKKFLRDDAHIRQFTNCVVQNLDLQGVDENALLMGFAPEPS